MPNTDKEKGRLPVSAGGLHYWEQRECGHGRKSVFYYCLCCAKALVNPKEQKLNTQ